jgi:hypothetical protein
MPYTIYREVSDGHEYARFMFQTFETKEEAEETAYYENEYADYPTERYVVVYEE